MAEIERDLTGPGAPFEIVEEEVLGERMPVFAERPRSLRELLQASLGLGDAEHIVAGDRRISFAENARVVASVARALRDDYGVGKGDRVAILAANCPEWIVSFWAATSLGAICVGLNGWWVRDEILYGLGDCEPAVLIGDRKRLARIEGERLSMPVVEIESGFDALWNRDAGPGPDAALPDVPIDEDDAATILYTSGTTGRPKGAVNTHRNIIGLTRVQVYHGVRSMLHSAQTRAEGEAPPPAANVCLVTTPLFHVSGLYAGVVTALATGLKTVWTTGRFDPVQVMQLIEREGVRTWGPMGTMLHRLMSHPDLPQYDLSSVTQMGSGGAPMPEALLERMREVFPGARRSMGVGYGLTEGTALATLNYGDDLLAHPGSVGRPLPTVQVEIRDGDGKKVSDGVEGEIHLRGPLVMKEYWRKPAETAEAIGPGRWLCTGDMGRLESGRLFIASRKRDLILRGGENVYPAEIEQCLERHPDVAEAAVVGVDHEELGQEVKAFVVPEPGREVDAAALTPAALTDWASQRLAYFKVPAHWELRREPLPRNATGKVLKHLLVTAGDNPFEEE
ncbi:MAG: class I adenylate-forming enzyme family protein [Proteobacteria bacterium]|nr:class I adenylate-forming enzyme family protein [Pseudomonadota bacterium]